jgi:hypothetical protein
MGSTCLAIAARLGNQLFEPVARKKNRRRFFYGALGICGVNDFGDLAAELPPLSQDLFRRLTTGALQIAQGVADLIIHGQDLLQGTGEFRQIFKPMTIRAGDRKIGVAHIFANGVRAVTLHAIDARLLTIFGEVTAGLEDRELRLMTGAADFKNLVCPGFADEVLRVCGLFVCSRSVASVTVSARDTAARMGAVQEELAGFVIILLMTGEAIVRRFLRSLDRLRFIKSANRSDGCKKEDDELNCLSAQDFLMDLYGRPCLQARFSQFFTLKEGRLPQGRPYRCFSFFIYP